MQVFTFLEYCISMIFLLLFMGTMASRRYSKSITAVICSICFIFTSFLDYHQYDGLHESNSILVTLIEIVLVQGTAILISVYHDERALFCGIFSADYVLIGNITATVVYMESGKIWLALFMEIVIHTLIFAYFVVSGGKIFREDMDTIRGVWGPLCVQLSLIYAVVFLLSVWPNNILDSPQMIIPVMLILVILVIIYVVSIRMIHHVHQLHDYEQNSIITRTVQESVRRELAAIEETSRRTQIMRHDMRHYANIAQSYLDDGRIEELKKMINEMNERLVMLETVKYCSIVSINSILSFYKTMCEHEKIAFECIVNIPDRTGISENDLASVIANLTENGVRSVRSITDETRRRVIVRIYPVKQQLMVEVENPYDKRPVFSKATGLPVSNQGEGHGFGLQSVKQFAVDQGGLCDFTATEGIFSAKVLLPIERRKTRNI